MISAIPLPYTSDVLARDAQKERARDVQKRKIIAL